MHAQPLASARDAFVEALLAVADLASSLTDEEWMRPSGCRGWAVCDVLCHLHIGLQEALAASMSLTDRPADTDYVSYWRDWSPGGARAFAHARFVRRVASAYAEPSGLAGHMAPTIAACVLRAEEAEEDWRVDWQGKVRPFSDFLVTWAVEGTIHHLDATLHLASARQASRTALGFVRATLDGLLGCAVPVDWTDEEYALKGTGRLPLSTAEVEQLGSLADRFPLFG